MERIIIHEEKCVGCNKCLRYCPVFEANISYVKDNQNKVRIDEKKCIHCGMCIQKCDHDARDYVDDTEQFFVDLQSGSKITVIAAPSIRANIPDYKRLFGYLRSLGVDIIYDVSFGADITTWAYLKHIKENKLKSVVAQPCPVIVNYIQKYAPAILDKLSRVHSPALCTAVYLKKYQNVQNTIAFLSPCVAKKDEFEDPNTGQYVKYNVTYKKLNDYLVKNQLDYYKFDEKDFQDIGCSLGCLYSRPGGAAGKCGGLSA